MNFNSHAHVERDTADDSTKELGNDFNSHAHVERDTLHETGSVRTNISTHTLTWSVTG